MREAECRVCPADWLAVSAVSATHTHASRHVTRPRRRVLDKYRDYISVFQRSRRTTSRAVRAIVPRCSPSRRPAAAAADDDNGDALP